MKVRSAKYLIVELSVMTLLFFALFGVELAYQAEVLPISFAFFVTPYVILAAGIVSVGFMIDFAVKATEKVMVYFANV